MVLWMHGFTRMNIFLLRSNRYMPDNLCRCFLHVQHPLDYSLGGVSFGLYTLFLFHTDIFDI